MVQTFFAQKARQFSDMGITNPFNVHHRAFYREIALLEGDDPSRLWLGYIRLDDKILATFSGARGHDRLVIVLCSLAEGDQWAGMVKPLFDSFIAFKPRGLALTLPLTARSRLKRAIKTSRYVWPVAQNLRARLFGRPGRPNAD
jgi:CelD/BcsL family acetyltransferase involved in cellulose biosynthesis